MANIISDIAGHYLTLQALLKKCPDEEPISVGDMVDRGPRSKEVIEFFMKNGRAILGNHEHMMLDHCRDEGYYEHGTWLGNGGRKTLLSYSPDAAYRPYGNIVPEEVLVWIGHLPKYIELNGILISHSFIAPDLTLKEACDFGKSIWEVDETRIIWNRQPPIRRPEWNLQICGHNSQFGLTTFEDDQGPFAICLDDCRYKRLTAYNTTTQTIYQQDYID